MDVNEMASKGGKARAAKLSPERRKEIAMQGVRARTSQCSMMVIGLDLECPLCGVLVTSGNTHTCSKSARKAKERK